MSEMNASISLYLLLLFSVHYYPETNAKTKTLKIIIPSKIRYVHHHHTHVLVMKDKKPYRGPDAKYHHLHFYDPHGRKTKGSNHYFIPFVPQVEDEIEEETAPNYAITAPKLGSYHEPDNYRPVSNSQLRPVYREPEYYSSSKKYRAYSRADIPQNEYYETDPFFALKRLTKDYEKPVMAGENQDDYEHSKELVQSHNEGHADIYEVEPLFYPEKKLYASKKIPYLY